MAKGYLSRCVDVGAHAFAFALALSLALAPTLARAAPVRANFMAVAVKDWGAGGSTAVADGAPDFVAIAVVDWGVVISAAIAVVGAVGIWDPIVPLSCCRIGCYPTEPVPVS